MAFGFNLFDGLDNNVVSWIKNVFSFIPNGGDWWRQSQMIKRLKETGAYNNLVGYWSTNGNSKDNININNGVDVSVTYGLGLYGQTGIYNGTTSKTQISTSASSPFRQSSEISYSFWVNIPTGGSARAGVATSGGHGSGGILVALGGLGFNWTPTAPGSDRAWQTITTLTAGVWYHIVFTMNFNSSSQGIFYINGVPQTTTISTNDVTNGVPTITYNNANGDCIGARYVNSFAYGNASIEEFMLFNKVLTPTEVNIIYNRF